MSEFDDFSLETILLGIKPNLLTPSLNDVVAVSNEKKPKVIANIIVRAMHKGLTHPVTKDVLHDGKVHKIRYFDIEPLLTGVWPVVSLMILQLSYGEQCTIIDTIYPEKIRLTAKSFAINFTPDVATTNVQIENETELRDKLDSANAGIATIIAMLWSQGSKSPHPDIVKRSLSDMDKLVTQAHDSKKFAQASQRANEANRYQDRQQ